MKEFFCIDSSVFVVGKLKCATYIFQGAKEVAKTNKFKQK